MNHKLTSAEKRQVQAIEKRLQGVMESAERLHEVVFKNGKQILFFHPRFKNVVRNKEIAIRALFRIRNSLDKLKGEKYS